MNQYKVKLQWRLILSLGALALLRPVLSKLGWSEMIGQPTASITITILISLIWLAVIVYRRVRQPLLTLMFTGMSYGVFAIILSAMLSPILTGRLQGPVTNPFAIVSVLMTNAIWGLVVGLLAAAKLKRKGELG